MWHNVVGVVITYIQHSTRFIISYNIQWSIINDIFENFDADMTVGEWNGSIVWVNLMPLDCSGGYLDKALNTNQLNFEVTNALTE